MVMGTMNGKLLDINLLTGSITERTIAEKDLRDYIGGGGLAAKLFVDDNVPIDCDPLGPDNNLYIITGPCTGTGFPATPRFSAAAKSPLTGIWGEANCGGYFGPALKSAGWDGIIVSGQSDKPVMLVIEDQNAELQDAADLWGKDTYETVNSLEGRFEGQPTARILSIGQAGENLVKFANVADGNHDFLGRTGLGAVMGSKKLKAVAVRGSGKLMAADEDSFKELRKAGVENIKKDMLAQVFGAQGTNSGMVFSHLRGDVPMKNWSLGQDENLAQSLSSDVMDEKYLTKASACYACSIACKRNVKVDEGPYKMDPGPGPEYETMASLGAMCMVTDQAAVNKMNDLCNRFGVDTISCGCTIAFAIDCYESGLLTDSDTDGLKLNWGNADAVIELIQKIGNREGIGDMLAEGSRAAAKKIGKGAEDLTAEVKGLEVPMHDPRTYHGLGLAYATSIRGACHLSHTMLFMDEGFFGLPEYGLEGPYEWPAFGQTSENKGKYLPICEDYAQFMNSTGICWFGTGALRGSKDIVKLISTTSGFDYSLEELMKAGERTWLLKRSLDVMMGVTVEDDRLPKKILTPVKEGPAADKVPDMELMIKEYIEARGLDERGVPKKETLADLGLVDVAERL
jgi:aldehyde:ferredoxin oxidoreductase